MPLTFRHSRRLARNRVTVSRAGVSVGRRVGPVSLSTSGRGSIRLGKGFRLAIPFLRSATEAAMEVEADCHNERAEGGAAAASARSAAAKRVPDHQRPPSAPWLSARDALDLELIARQGRTLGEKPWVLTSPPEA